MTSGPAHPLTPRRFGPGIDLLRAVGAEPGLAPEPAPDADLLLCPLASGTCAAVKRLSADPIGPVGGGHRATAATTRRSPACTRRRRPWPAARMRAMEAILRGDVEHAFHPGGGLHHAMRDRGIGLLHLRRPGARDRPRPASRAARAVPRLRRPSRRRRPGDPPRRSGRHDRLVPRVGPLPVPRHGLRQRAWLGRGRGDERQHAVRAADRGAVPGWPRCACSCPRWPRRSGPTSSSSQHGADSHAWDPLAHMLVTTTAMGEAARLDRRDRPPVCRAADGWRRAAAATTPIGWCPVRGRWSGWQAPIAMPRRPRPSDGASAGTNEGAQLRPGAAPRHLRRPAECRRCRSRRSRNAPRRRQTRPRALVRRHRRAAAAPRRDRRALVVARGAAPAQSDRAANPFGRRPLAGADDRRQPRRRTSLERLDLAARVVPPADAAEARALLVAAVRDGARVTAAIADGMIVGAAVLAPARPHPSDVDPAVGGRGTRRRAGVPRPTASAARSSRPPSPASRAIR